MKKWFVLPALLLALAGLVLTGCPTDPDEDPEYEKGFTFAKKGTVTIASNTWSGGSNDQAQLSGTQSGAIRNGKTYKIKVTGTLEKAAVLKFVFIDNKAGDWKVLSEYGQIDDTSAAVDEDGKYPPKVLSAGDIEQEWKVKATMDAGGSEATNNIVVLISNKDATEGQEQGQNGNSITGAVVLIAEDGQPYPPEPGDVPSAGWGAAGVPSGATEAEIASAKPSEWHTVDLDYTSTAVQENQTINYELYIPGTATFPEGDGFQIQFAQGTPEWKNVALDNKGSAGIQITDFAVSGNYKKYMGAIVASSANGFQSGAANITKIQIADGYVAYNGKIAVKIVSVTN